MIFFSFFFLWDNIVISICENTLKPDNVRQEEGGGQTLQHDVQAEQEECGAREVRDSGAVKHPGAAEAEQERVEHGDHGSQGALGLSDQFQHFEPSLGIG